VISIGILYVLALSPLLMEPKKMLRGYRSVAWFAPLILFCLVSAAWSASPSLTLRRGFFLALTTLTGLVLGTKYSLSELARMLALASVLHFALVLVFFVVDPRQIFSLSDGHALKGLTTHKNIFGFEAGLAVLVFLLVPFRRMAMLRWPLAATAFLLLVLSRSAGSLVSTLVALAFLPFLWLLRFRGLQRIPLLLLSFTTMAVAVWFLVQNLALVPQVLSKDPTLTGRTELWTLVVQAIGQRPMLGYGFDSFWMGLQGESLGIIRDVGWLVPTAHNGYLDLLLGTGIVGVLLFLPLLLQSLRRAIQTADTLTGSERYFPAAFLLFLLVYNLNESALITRSGIPFLLFVSINVATTRARNARQATSLKALYPATTFGLGASSLAR